MKRVFLYGLILLLMLTGNSAASFVSGSTGADGAFDPAASPPQVPAGTAISGTTATVPLPANGIFNFTTVNVPTGWTVKFSKNAANTPVYILASGNVTIAGTIDVSGKSAVANSSAPGSGGPGGYDGGFGGATAQSAGAGLGPGGGGRGDSSLCYWGVGSHAGGGGFGTVGASGCGEGVGGSMYGNERLIPLIGGSGGGGGAERDVPTEGGGGGGGAILIASSGTILINGSVLASGGDGRDYSGGGSGGAIKIMADTISGSGVISAKGGTLSGVDGGKGRIRFETYNNNFVPGTDPPCTRSIYSENNPPRPAIPVPAPTLRITSIAGSNVPTNPTGSYAQPDIMLPNTTTNPVTVALSASYIPAGTTVTVSVIPQYGSSINATTALSGTEASSTGSANVYLSTQYSNVIMATATYVMQQAMYWEGEKIEKVRVAAAMGKESETVYVTEKGREIKAKELILAGLVR